MKQKGFTILETIIAITVVSLAVGGVFSAVRTGLVGSMVSKDETRAFFLAQEAIEILRQKRDSNKLLAINTNTNVNWLSGISENASSDPCRANATCRVDGTNQALTYCGAAWNSCPFLLQDGNYRYGYASGNTTRYKREIQIECSGACSSSNEARVTIRVSWTQGSNTHQLQVKTLLMNWR